MLLQYCVTQCHVVELKKSCTAFVNRIVHVLSADSVILGQFIQLKDLTLTASRSNRLEKKPKIQGMNREIATPPKQPAEFLRLPLQNGISRSCPPLIYRKRSY